MPLTGLQAVNERFMVVVFVVGMLVIVYQVAVGTVWVILDSASVVAWLSIITPFAAAGASIVSTYTFVFYNQQNTLRDLVLSMLSLSTACLSVLYLITHAGFPFATILPSAVYKTNLLAIIGGLVIATGFLAYSWLGSRTASRTSRELTISVGFGLPMAVALVVSAIPSTEPPLSWEILGLVGAAVVTIILGEVVYSIVTGIRHWSRRTDSIPTGIILFLLMFVVSDVLSWYTVNQFVEVVAIFSLSIGFSLLALSMMTTSVSEPHRGLAQVVRDRTGLLEQTKNESEFYLNIWSHEVGNVLQGIILFVEQVAMMDVPSAELPALAETARGLTERASETIRQVSELARIKEQDAKLDVIDLGAVVSESVQDLSVRFLEYPNSIQISRLEGGLLVNADSLLGHLFTYMIRNILARSGDGGCHLRIIAYKKADLVCLEVRDDSRPLPEGAARFLTGEARPMHTEIGLDLFIVRNLMTRYRGRISTEQLESVGENLTVFMFNQTQPSHQ